MLILTHECADAASWDLGRWQEHLHPVRPVLLFGRAARLPPECAVEHAVWYGWRDSRAISAIRHPISTRARQCHRPLILVTTAEPVHVWNSSMPPTSTMSLVPYSCHSYPELHANRTPFHSLHQQNPLPTPTPPHPQLPPHPIPMECFSVARSVQLCLYFNCGAACYSSGPMSSPCRCAGDFTFRNLCIQCQQFNAPRDL